MAAVTFAAEYYDKNLFDGKTFGDILARKGPMIVINATDMVHGTRISFVQDAFDTICSDLTSYPGCQCLRCIVGGAHHLDPDHLAKLRRQVRLSNAQGACRGHATPLKTFRCVVSILPTT